MEIFPALFPSLILASVDILKICRLSLFKFVFIVTRDHFQNSMSIDFSFTKY